MTDASQPTSPTEALKQSFIALKRARARIEALEERRFEPIAIVGMACRFPGGANDPDALWDLLCRGVDTCGPVPPERWPSELFYDPASASPGKTHAARAHFLDVPVDAFDAPFFGVSVKEATSMDPQQRLLLEVGWEAIEDAGLDPAALRGSRTGVYVGISSDDYAQAHRHSGRLELIDGYSLTGTCLAPAAGRISYTFGFEGPSLAVDTACSSSLVAVHLACQSLRDGETSLALVGGVNLILSPVFHIASSKLGTISPDGLCKTFDSSADGYGRGEGCGAIVLKRLSDAEAAGDRILAVIRGSAVNQDGKSNGLTAPNGLAQERVIREALDRAGLEPSDIGYIEVHGTGTSLGDPIEVEAIGRVMAERPAERPVVLGTVKSNIGHLEAAAGVAGLIRAVQCLRHGEIPAHLHLDDPSPHIPWGGYPFEVLTRRRPWDAGGESRRAGVSSFGFSGTNAHVILEEAPAPAAAEDDARPAVLLPLSARTPEGLHALAERWRQWLEAPSASLSRACATAAVGRSHMAQRLAIVARTEDELTAALDGFLDGRPGRSVAVGNAGNGRPKVAGLFTGQGSQYPGMGRDLYAGEPVFRDTVLACDEAIGDRLGRRLTDLLYGSDASDAELQQTGFAQPALFAVELALYRLWESWGIVPDLVCGHSIGEYAAAHVAGILSFEQAVDMVCERGRLMQSLPAGGAMAAVFAAEAVVAPLLRPSDGVSLAAVNTPNDVVVSGHEQGVADLLRRLGEIGVQSQALRVSHAFHSGLMRPILRDFEAVADRAYGAAEIPFVSTVTGRKAAAGELANPAYWVRQIESPVRFAAAAATLADEGAQVFLEYGPSPVLAALARQSVVAEGRQFLGSLLRGSGDDRPMLESLARLYAAGADIDWKAVLGQSGGQRASIPRYPFQRKSYYRAPIVDAGRHAPQVAAASSGHPYLGQRVHSRLLPPGAALHQALFTAEEPAFLVEHQIFGKIISPAAAHLSMAFAAGGNARALEDVSFQAPLVIEPDAARLVQLTIEGGRSDAYTLSSQPAEKPGDAWVVHCQGRMASPQEPPPPVDLPAVRARCPGTMPAPEFYALIETLGYKTGEGFQSIREIHKGDGEALCRVEPAQPIDPGAIHPGLIDSMLQTVLPACEASAAHLLDGKSILIPLHVGRIALYGNLDQPLYCHSRVTVAGELVKAQLTACSADGHAIAVIEDFLLKRTDRETLYQELSDEDRALTCRIEWQPLEPEAPEAVDPPEWVVFSEAEGWGATVAAQIRAAGGHCLELIRSGDPAEPGPDRFVVEPGRRDVVETLIRPWLVVRGRPRANLLFAWSGNGENPVADCRETIEALLPAVQELGSGVVPIEVRLWLLTRQAHNVVPEDGAAAGALEGGILWGFGRAVAEEMPEIWGGLVDVESRPSASAAAALVSRLELSSGEDQIALRRGDVFGARLAPAAAHPEIICADVGERQKYMLARGPRRTLDDLRFERSERLAPRAGEVEIEVLTAGLNFRDVLNALGQYPGEAGLLGFEAVGVVVARGPGLEDIELGETVIALAAPGCIGSHVTVSRGLVVRKPPSLTAVEAVGLPAAFLTAYYALHHLGNLRRGERVLIHAAAGGVGLAAVQIALAAGAEVFATAGSPEKQEFLRGMGVEHIMSSRTTKFERQVLDATGGAGVDLVLNSLSGDFIAASFAALAPGGRFLEMGKIGIWDEARAHARDPSCTYRPFDLAAVAAQDPAPLMEMFEQLLRDIERGRLTPLPLAVFPMAEAEEAFRYMAQARHIGKIALSREDERRVSRLRARGPVRSDASYIVTGAFGALGLRVARWLVDAGARHLVLAGRRGPGSAAAAALAELTAQGAAVTVVEGDVAVEEDVQRMVAAASAPPLAGIVHAAGLLDDGMIADLDGEKLDRVFAPKVAGAWHLHRATERLDLDFFVLFSSVAAIIGNLGQSAYSAANAFMDALAVQRRRRGLAATSINWGPWAEAGMAAELETDRFEAQGIRALAPAQALRTMGRLMTEAPVQAIVASVDWGAYGRSHGLDDRSGLFAGLVGGPAGAPAEAPEESGTRDILADLAAALPTQREELMRSYLQDLARQTLGYARGEVIATDKPLADQGFDSLMSVDMRNRLNRGLGRMLPASLLFDYPTVERIAAHLLETAVPAADAPGSEPALSAAAILDEIETLLAPPADAAQAAE